MAKENADGQEKTEDPTGKKLSKAREEGQVPRSQELNSFLVLIAGSLCFLYFGHILLAYVTQVAESFFRVERELLKSPLAIVSQVEIAVYGFLKTVMKFLVAITLVSVASPILMGGWNFSFKALKPKFNKLNPISGLKRMVSLKSILNIFLSVGKFLLVAPVAVFMVAWYAPTLHGLPWTDVNYAMATAIEVLIWTFLMISSAIIVIVLIDVPYQLWNHNEQMKMTKQEVKQENKDTDGSPEAKRRVRQAQFEMAQQRMMEKVAEADVVITNPTHYAVALRYDQDNDYAPILLAKGQNLIALKIREIAQEHDIMVLEAPPLARSIYHTTEVNQEIPTGLYLAVAQVLAYVHQLRAFRKGQSTRPTAPKDLNVPPELRYDE